MDHMAISHGEGRVDFSIGNVLWGPGGGGGGGKLGQFGGGGS